MGTYGRFIGFQLEPSIFLIVGLIDVALE